MINAPHGNEIIVFTDLDGTLLDHDTYGFEPARPALAMLARKKIPVTLNSSKTMVICFEKNLQPDRAVTVPPKDLPAKWQEAGVDLISEKNVQLDTGPELAPYQSMWIRTTKIQTP